jgi:hypothetical protein
MSQYWEQCINILHDIKFQTSIDTSTGHHRGLAIQVLLDYETIEDTKELTNQLLNIFPVTPLIVIGEIDIIFKNIPIGQYQDDSLVEIGRHFDHLVKTRKKGLIEYKK